MKLSITAPTTSVSNVASNAGHEPTVSIPRLPSSVDNETQSAASATPNSTKLAHLTVPLTVPEIVVLGHNITREYKSKTPRPARPLPKPAKPRAPKVSNVKMSRRAMLAHARCLRRNNAMMTERLERISRPLRRRVVYLWREHSRVLPPEAIARFRRMLDADEPCMPDQAYQYFVNLRHQRSQNKKSKKECAKKGMAAIGVDKRYEWARHATVKFARGIQKRLARPGHYPLMGRMQRISNIILRGLCKTMKEPLPRGRCSCRPKSKFMIEMADKIAIWIDEILLESDVRMLMMDFDEDYDVLKVLKKEASKKPVVGEPKYSEEQLVERGLQLSVSAFTKADKKKKSESSVTVNTQLKKN